MGNNEASFEVGDIVYIEKKIREVSTWEWLKGQSDNYAKYKDHEFKGCGHAPAKGKIMRNFVSCTGPENPTCIRHCIEHEDGTPLGCWAPKNLLSEADCSHARRVARWAIGGSTQESMNVSKRPLLYRKFNILLRDVRLRTRLFVHRTRSLHEVVNQEPE